MNGPAAGLGPWLVGSLVWGIGLSLGVTTAYAINTARDLGPRVNPPRTATHSRQRRIELELRAHSHRRRPRRRSARGPAAAFRAFVRSPTSRASFVPPFPQRAGERPLSRFLNRRHHSRNDATTASAAMAAVFGAHNARAKRRGAPAIGVEESFFRGSPIRPQDQWRFRAWAFPPWPRRWLPRSRSAAW